MAYYPNPFDEDEEERRRRLGLAADTETEESTEPKPMSEMSNREAVAAAYDKQHPYGGTATMTGPLGNISYYDEELKRPRLEDAVNTENEYPVLRSDKKNIFNNGIEQYVKNTPKNFLGNSPFGQIFGATRDLGENYINMINANLRSNTEMKEKGITIDNYYHCKGNYDASKRGPLGLMTSLGLGAVREIGDFALNTTREKNRLSPMEALQDGVNDIKINLTGNKNALDNQYNSAEEACAKYKPQDYDEDEERKRWYRRYRNRW